jgi:TolB-like protein/Tfp pilus assembly protein PilF
MKDLNRRSILQVLGIYLAGSWGALEAVGMIVETAGLPDWLPALALILLIIGLPIIVATAFLQSHVSGSADEPIEAPGRADTLQPATPTTQARGSTRQASARRSAPATPGLAGFFTWRNAIAGGLAAFALWGLVATALLVRGGGGGAPADPSELAVAVLPFASTGNTAEDESFALGIHDDLLTHLARISSFRVISRTSVMPYKDSPKNVVEIARELGAQVILEGSVQRAGDQIHLNAQLIDAREAEGHLWAENFDRRLTVANIFLIQRELAERIAGAMQATLSPEEQEEVGSAPTENLEAYTLYLKANNYFNAGPRSDDFQLALDLYRQAIDLDPGFGQAYARLALALGTLAEVEPDEEGLLEEVKRNAELSLALDDTNAEAHLALGQYYYTGFRDYESSLREISAARTAGLNSAELYHNLGATQRRMGDFDGGIQSFEEAVRLNPLSAHYYEDLGSTYTSAGRMEEGIQRLRTAITLAPDVGSAYNFLFWALVNQDGNTARARTVLEDFEAQMGFPPDWHYMWVHWYERDFEAAAELADSVGGPIDRAFIAERLGRDAEARTFWEQALEWNRGWLAEVRGASTIQLTREEANPRMGIGMALASLGQPVEAIQEAEAAMEVLPISLDAMDGPDLALRGAYVFMRAGETDRAIALLEELVAGPNEITTAILKLDPWWDPIRDDPRFQALVGS